uniref:MABP1/WDR62 second WD40 domain-containing protein n=1 Tax=Eptatretus burgeri TaxID=7764 RepID=A0A8C4NM33_EPTBU
MDDRVFAVTRSGLLCEIEQRVLQRYIELKASSALCLAAGDGMIFCGCTNGVVRVFAMDLHFLFNLPRPHCLGENMTPGTELPKPQKDPNVARFPDVVALSHNGARHWLACAYSDHSLYVWHVGESPDGEHITCEFSALYHSACVWGVEMYPELPEGLLLSLPIGSFITASDDNTLRMWHARPYASPSKASRLHQNVNSLKVIHIEEAVGRDASSVSCEVVGGLRALCINPDGQELASGDRIGNVRIHDLHGQQETRLLAAHNSEVLCLNYLPTKSSNLRLLASASRDRLIHVFDAANNYALLQTLDEHSSSITAVRLIENGQQVHMISCGGDKSIYFHAALMTADGPQFNRTHHVVEKCTLYDMTVDIDGKYAVVGCQDRMVRMFSVESGKQKKAYKGAQGDDGSLIKVQLDPSGTFVVTSCTDKFLSIFDFHSGECIASACGHSEIVKSMKFSDDGRHLISASGDSCLFVWRLPADMTNSITRQRSSALGLASSFAKPTPASFTAMRRETFTSIPRLDPWLDPCQDLENSSLMVKDNHVEQPSPLSMLARNEREAFVHAFLQSTGRTPDWAKSQNGVTCATRSQAAQVKSKLLAQSTQALPPGLRRCWGVDLDPSGIACHLDKLSRLASTLSPVTPSPKPSLTTLTCKDLANSNALLPSTLEVVLEGGENSFSRSIDTGDVYLSSAVDTSKSNDSLLHFQGIPEADIESGLYKVQGVVRESTQSEKTDSPYSSCSSLRVCETEHSRHSVSNSSDGTGSTDLNNDVENIPPQTGDVPETLCDAFLRQNFATLTDAVSEENFNHSLQELQPVSIVSLNPRLSISTRFLGKARAARRVPPSTVNQQHLLNSCGPAIWKTKVLKSQSCSSNNLIPTNYLVHAEQSKTEPDTFLPFSQCNGFEGQTKSCKLKSQSLHVLRKSSSVGDIPSKSSSTSAVKLAKSFSLSPPLYRPTIKPSRHSFSAWESSSAIGGGETHAVRSQKGLSLLSSTYCLSQAGLIPSSTTEITAAVLLPENCSIESPSPHAPVLKISRRRHSSPMPCWIAASEFSGEEENGGDLGSWINPNCSPQDGHLEKECPAELSVEAESTESELERSSIGSDVMEPCHNGSNELGVQLVGLQVEREGEALSPNPVSNSSGQWVSAVENLEVDNSNDGGQARPTGGEATEQSTEAKRPPVEIEEVHIQAVPENVDKSTCQEVAADLQRAFEQAISTYVQVVMVQGESCTALQEVFSTIEEKLRGLPHMSSQPQCHVSLPDGLLQGLLEQYSDKLLQLVSTKLETSAPN